MPQPREYVVAVDLGGTWTKVAYAERDGATSTPRRLRTLTGAGRVPLDWFAGVLAEAVRAAPSGRCVGYGVAVPGVIDVPRGVVRAAPNVGWYDVSLRAELDRRTGMTGTVAHDVRSGGLAEWRAGAGRGATDLLFLALGTGVAGAMVVDGRLVDADGYAGEIGHVVVPAAAGQECLCGQRGCLETVASATGVVRTYGGLAPAPAPAAPPPDARVIADLARRGDPHARAAYALAVQALTEGLVSYATLLGPETVVVGGGLAAAFDLVGPPVEAGVAAAMTFQRRPRLVPAAFGADAGVVGAGLVGWDRLRRKESR